MLGTFHREKAKVLVHQEKMKSNLMHNKQFIEFERYIFRLLI